MRGAGRLWCRHSAGWAAGWPPRIAAQFLAARSIRRLSAGHSLDRLPHRLPGRLGADQPTAQIDVGLRDGRAFHRRVGGQRQLDAGEQHGLGSHPDQRADPLHRQAHRLRGHIAVRVGLHLQGWRVSHDDYLPSGWVSGNRARAAMPPAGSGTATACAPSRRAWMTTSSRRSGTHCAAAGPCGHPPGVLASAPHWVQANPGISPPTGTTTSPAESGTTLFVFHHLSSSRAGPEPKVPQKAAKDRQLRRRLASASTGRPGADRPPDGGIPPPWPRKTGGHVIGLWNGRRPDESGRSSR